MNQLGVHYCGLIVTIALLYFTFRVKPLPLLSIHIYRTGLLFAFGTLILGIASTYALIYFDNLPLLLTDILCKLYLVFIIVVIVCSFVYVSTSLPSRFSQKFYERSGVVWGFVSAAIILFLPIEYRLIPGQLETTGPSVFASYAIGLISSFAIILFILINRNNIPQRRMYATFFWMGTWLASAAIQFFFPAFPVIGFGVAMGLNIVFSSLESPESFLDRETGLFNTYAKTSVMQEHFTHNKPFSLLLMNTGIGEKGLSYDTQNYAMLHIAKELKAKTDFTIYRHTSETFALISKEKSECMLAVSLIKDMFKDPFTISGQSILVSPTFTLIEDSSIAESATEITLIQNYYSSINSESELILIDENMIKEMRNEQHVKAMILEALVEDRLEVFLQPIYSNELDRFTSAEALARIRDKDGNIVPPGIFIPIAEKSSDLIMKIGERVMIKVCEYIKNNDIRSMGMKYIEVNLSVEQCETTSLADDFLSIIKNTGISPDLICLEITESASIKSRDTLLENMNKLRDHGILFCLDDFGTGASNLNYVMTMPVDIIKFDRDLTQAYFENIRAKFVMDNVIVMVKNMDMQIVSEGVETKEQLATVKELGIDYVQGYVFSKPLPADEFTEFIKNNNKI